MVYTLGSCQKREARNLDELLSVIIPAYNEEATVIRSAPAIGGVLAEAGIPYELVYVDDGSRDETWPLIQKLAADDPHVRGVSFSRNFGKDRAVFAGLSRARGACCVVMDCDLQHPPETLVEMYRLWQSGWQIVEGVKADRGKESPVYRLCAGAFYGVISKAAGFDMRRSSDFRLLDRKVVDTLLALPEQEAFFRGLSSWVGYKKTTVEFSVAERVGGESKWSIAALFRYAFSCVMSLSTAPLQIATVLGGSFLLATLICSVVMAATGGPSAGWQVCFSILAVAAAGCLLLCLGILGSYTARIFRQANGRPRYIIADECGVIHDGTTEKTI